MKGMGIIFSSKDEVEQHQLVQVKFRVFFCPFSKKLKAAIKKTLANLWQKTLWRQLWVLQKNSTNFDKDIQNLFKSSLDFQ